MNVNLCYPFVQGVKASRTVDEIIIDQAVNRNSEIIDLHYEIQRKKDKKSSSHKYLKRKVTKRALIIDPITTISHQAIRENMNKKCSNLVNKNSLFPNPIVTRSLKAQIACSTFNLFDFPGSQPTLRCYRHLNLWMRCKDKLKNRQSPFTEYEDNLRKTPENGEIPVADFSDMPIEIVRETSSFNMNTQLDSFTFGSDNFQKSIRQSSFDVDKTLEENDKIAGEHNEYPNFSVDKSMMPITEEDCNRKQFFADENIPVANGNHTPNENNSTLGKEVKIGKSEIWDKIQLLLKVQLEDGCNRWNEIRISFLDICPIHSSRKTASLVFVTLLRLGKYKKIRIFQDNPFSDILIGLPAKEI